MTRRRIPGLRETAPSQSADVPDGLYLVRVDRVQYRYDRQKPYFSVRLAVIEPAHFADRLLRGRLYCTPKALWKLSWFLRDFGYDSDLLIRDEIDEKALVGLQGVVKTSHVVIHGRSLLNLDAFAPAEAWEVAS